MMNGIRVSRGFSDRWLTTIAKNKKQMKRDSLRKGVWERKLMPGNEREIVLEITDGANADAWGRKGQSTGVDRYSRTVHYFVAQDTASGRYPGGEGGVSIWEGVGEPTWGKHMESRASNRELGE